MFFTKNDEDNDNMMLEVNNDDAKSMLVQFIDCRPNFDAKFCEECQRLLRNSLMSCPICNADYSKCSHYWDIYFTIDENNYQTFLEDDENKYKRSNRRLNVVARGDVLDPIIGLSAKDFFYLCERVPSIDWYEYLIKYFIKFDFIITLDSVEKIKQICLKHGNSMTFKQWITTASKDVSIDQETITSIVLERYLNDDNPF